MSQQLRHLSFQSKALVLCLLIACALVGPAELCAQDPGAPPSSSAVAVDRPFQAARRSPAVAVSADGRILVVWEVRTLANRSRGILGRVFEAGLGKASPVFRVAFGPAEAPAAAWDPTGGFGVVWSGPSTGVWRRLFDPDGSAKGPPIVVQAGGFIERASSPRLAFLGGQWAVVWSAYQADLRGSIPFSWLAAKRMDTEGRLTGIAAALFFRLYVDTDFDYELAADPVHQQGVIVSRPFWPGNDVVATRYGLDGKEVSSALVADDPVSLLGSFGVAVDGAGLAAVVWSEGGRIHGRRVQRDGKLRSQGEVDPNIEGLQTEPAVGVLGDGHALVVWERSPSTTFKPQIQARWFDPADRALGDAFRIVDRRSIVQTNPVAAGDRDFGVVVAWEELLRNRSVQVFVRYLARPGLR